MKYILIFLAIFFACKPEFKTPELDEIVVTGYSLNKRKEEYQPIKIEFKPIKVETEVTIKFGIE